MRPHLQRPCLGEQVRQAGPRCRRRLCCWHRKHGWGRWDVAVKGFRASGGRQTGHFSVYHANRGRQKPERARPGRAMPSVRRVLRGPLGSAGPR